MQLHRQRKREIERAHVCVHKYSMQIVYVLYNLLDAALRDATRQKRGEAAKRSCCCINEQQAATTGRVTHV